MTRPRIPFYASAAIALVIAFLALPAAAQDTPSSVPAGPQTLEGQVVPNLSVPIPTLRFSDVTFTENGTTRTIDIPFLAQYISALYRYGVGIAAVIAAVLAMVGGLQYLTAGADASRVTAAKQRISNAIVGLALALGSYAILSAINPDLINLSSLKILTVKPIAFEQQSFDDRTIGDDADFTDEQTPGSNPSPQAGAAAPTPPTASGDLDRIFQAYASCYGLNWPFLKAVARAESDLNPNAGAGTKYQGLFQESADYCNYNIAPFSSFLNCRDRLDPEVNTAAAANAMGKEVIQILGKCPNASVTEVALLMYVAHNNGPGVMSFMVNNGGCSEAQQRQAVRLYYARRCKLPGCDVNLPRSRPECLKNHIHPDCGERKWAYAYKSGIVRGAVQAGGIKANIVDKTICPMQTGKRVISR